MYRLDEERIHMENIVNSRFHYLLLILTVIIAGVIGAKSESQARTLFIFGVAISFGLGLTIIRAQLRLGILMDQIYFNFCHAATFARNETKKKKIYNPARCSWGWIIGYGFPIIFFIFMLFGVVHPKVVYIPVNPKNDLKEIKLSVSRIDDRLSVMENNLMSITKLR